MDPQRVVRAWLAGARKDWEVAQSLFKLKHYAHALFLCHLVLEKVLKALVLKRTKELAPQIHDLRRLSEEIYMATERASLKKVKKYIQEYIDTLQGDGLLVERVFLFGSYAKGKTRDWSDIDVCVISSRFGKKIDPYEYLWTKRRRDDVLRGIEPVGFHPKDFIDEDPLAWEIKTTGIEIWPNGAKKSSSRKGKPKRKTLP